MRLGEALMEFKERPPRGADYSVLTLTEKNGFVFQSDRFKKRLALEDTSGYKIVRRDDIAFNPYLLWAGAVAQNTICEIGVISPLYPTFRPRPGFDASYMARLLLSPQMVSTYDRIAFGSVPRRRRSSTADFLNLEIDPPPALADQQRIAAILDRADALRAKRKQVLVHLDSLAPRVFDHVFAGRSEPRVPMGELIAGQQIGLDRRSSEQGGDRAHGYMKMDAITRDGRLDLTRITRVDASAEEVRKYAVRDGDLLLNTRNSRELVGKSAVFYGSPHLYNNNVSRLRFCERVTPQYIHAFLWSRDGREQLESRKSGTTNVYAMYSKDFSTISVPVPPLDEQKSFDGAVSYIAQQQDDVRRLLQFDDGLFASLQHQAFVGKL
ncbi:restriction endonuclease subunit S [Clavibacter phaseoli]|uniref:restriction endonuclease subunit S n=1 Tax=Clavibacter phaseoli TaxID=1734031 RepID=UPI0011C213C7|nr:restriction endonuclease subunit S [Clavibacter phaseoli]UKF31879.1 restriction endonuclease subunit S [Clavibacter phaseoli]UKF37799.1 restriction endonuclease subunit S [Clavibacter phaseoli]